MTQSERIELERRIADLERKLHNIPLRVASGGGGGDGFEILTADTKANLPTDEDPPQLGYTTSTKRYYAWDGTVWIPISHLEVV